MTAKPFYKLTFSFARFNAKHSVDFADRSDAKRAAVEAEKNGIWVKDKEGTEVFWGPSAIAKISLETVLPES